MARQPLNAPTDELHALLQTVITRLIKMLTRRGVLVEEMGQTYLAEPVLMQRRRARCGHYRPRPSLTGIAFGPRAGQKVLTLRGAMPRDTTTRQPLCADIDGSSLRAVVRVDANNHKRLEQLCR
jgi:hypothetical protein